MLFIQGSAWSIDIAATVRGMEKRLDGMKIESNDQKEPSKSPAKTRFNNEPSQTTSSIVQAPFGSMNKYEDRWTATVLLSSEITMVTRI